jgi:hypothetical protein
MQALEPESAHAFVTDPPYASGVRAEVNRTASGAMVRGVKWRQKPIENDQMTTSSTRSWAADRRS